MAKPAVLKLYGSASANSLKDESGILVDSFTFNATRTKTELMDEDEKVVQVRLTNPLATLAFSGRIIGTPSGLANQHPGELISSLQNYQSSMHGFDPTEGIILYEDPSRDYSRDNRFVGISFSGVHYVYIEA